MDVEGYVDEVMNEKKDEKEEKEEKEEEENEKEEGMRKRKGGLDNPGFSKESALNGKPGSNEFNPEDTVGSKTEIFSSSFR